jgi:arginine-tRNA-protein transferase
VSVNQKKPDLFLSMPHPCSYLPGRMSTIMFVDPQSRIDDALYSDFVQHGFRRSGELVYRPYCRECNACVPVRVPVNEFKLNRAQKRVWRRNQDVVVAARAPQFDPGHFELYQRYQEARHSGSSMDDPDPERYLHFFFSRQVKTLFYELRLSPASGAESGRLLGVAVVDVLHDGLSAMYTFFEPDLPARSLGVYAILWQIQEARRLGLSWLYLGYWIEECPKMAYKIHYQPLEALAKGKWSRIAP